MKREISGSIICLLITFSTLIICTNARIVTLKSGAQISGNTLHGFTQYLGVPYAQPPIGDLRWTSPQPITISSDYQATSFKPACPQTESEGVPSDAYSEDCLYLNIWVPSGVESGSGLPVMVYIHGGGWEGGSGSLPLYWGDFISNSTDTLVVTFNYRLGSLGFLVSPVLGGNYGFEDQRAVLQWVNENIISFGGDPSRVTLFGQSAGGMSVAGHLTSPPSFGLFSKAISHSGPPVITFRTQEESYYFSDEFASKLGCANSSDVTCMRGQNITQIIDAQRKVKPNTSLPWLLNNFLIWMPVIDNVNIMGSSQDLLNEGKAAPNVDMIWGSTRNETAGWVMDFLPSIPILVSEYKILLSNFFGTNSQAVFNEYPASTPTQVRDSLSMLSTDWVFTCSQKHSAKAMATNPNGGLLRNFVFLHPPSTDPRDTGTVAHCADIQEVCHGAELDYVFHSAAFSNATFTSDEEELSWNCLNIWTGYADGTLTTDFWPTYQLSEDNSLAIDLNSIAMQENYRSSYCDFWESINAYGTIQN